MNVVVLQRYTWGLGFPPIRDLFLSPRGLYCIQNLYWGSPVHGNYLAFWRNAQKPMVSIVALKQRPIGEVMADPKQRRCGAPGRGGWGEALYDPIHPYMSHCL